MSGVSVGRGRCDEVLRCSLLPSLSPLVRAGSARLPPAGPAAGHCPPPVTVPAPGRGCRCRDGSLGSLGSGRPCPPGSEQTPTTPGTAGGRRGVEAVRAWKGSLAEPGHRGAEVHSVPRGAGAHFGSRYRQGTWPGCWQRDPPAPTLTGASRTASSSWGTAWPRTRRRRASSCRGCAESAGEYGAWPAWLLALPICSLLPS